MIDGVTQLEFTAGIDFDRPAASPLPGFVVGPENRLLAAVLAPLVEEVELTDQTRRFSPLTLVGDTGSGKSHLAGALARRWEALLGAEEVDSTTAVDFGRRVHAAISDGTLADRRKKWWSRQLVIVEDLQNLRPEASIQQEFRLLGDALTDRGGILIATAETEPAMLRTIDASVCDRLAAGLTVRIAAPGHDTRQALLALAAERRDMAASAEQIAELAARASGPAGRVLAGIAQWEAGLPAEAAASNLSLKEIICVTARYFGVTQAAVTGPLRRRSLVEARQQIVRLARTLTEASYAEIGRKLGGRDHTTIMHADRQIERQLETDPAARSAHEALRRILLAA